MTVLLYYCYDMILDRNDTIIVTVTLIGILILNIVSDSTIIMTMFNVISIPISSIP